MPTNLTKLIFYFMLTLSPFTWASEPSGAPILRLETGMHTAPINQISVDAQERFLLTASLDKTLRLWDLNDGKQIQIYRVPIGVNNQEGQLRAGAISPNGDWIAGGGDTGIEWEGGPSIYLFNRMTDKLVKRLYGLPANILYLCFSPDGQYLAASLAGNGGVHVWETQQWAQVFSDTQYGNSSTSCQFDSQNRLITSAWDGYLRLYSPTSGTFTLVTQAQAPGGKQPLRAVFSSNGNKIAVGFADSPQVNVLDGHTLGLLYAPDLNDILGSKVTFSMTWSDDEQQLCASGDYEDYSDNQPNFLIRCWSQGGQGGHTDYWLGTTMITHIRWLRSGELVYSSMEPSWGILDSTGKKRVEHTATTADYSSLIFGGFLVSYDGSTVQFGLKLLEYRPVRFSLFQSSLLTDPPTDPSLAGPDTTSLNITGVGTVQTKLNGIALPLTPNERSVSTAIAPDQSSFLLGAGFLRLFDAKGQLKWAVPVPGSVVWAVNISGDGQKAIAALGDGTIRWYNLRNGEELLALFPHVDGKRWIAWTPSGYYMSSGEDADNLLGWHVNHGKDQAASFYLVGQLYSKTYKKPEVVQRTLVTLSEKKALAELQAENTPNEPSTKPILQLETGMHIAPINWFDIDANEQFLMTASNDKTLRLWDLTTGGLITTYRIPIGAGSEGFLQAVAISPHGEWIAGGGKTGFEWDRSTSIYLFNRKTGKLFKRLVGLPEVISRLCFSPDGQYLAASLVASSVGKGIRVWETQQWTQVFSDTNYGDRSMSCQFDSQNRLLTSAWDGYLRLYSPTSGTFTLVTQAQAPGGKQPSHAVFSPRGDKIAVGFNDSAKVNVLDGQTLALLYAPDTSSIGNGALHSVTWSTDEQLLCAGGSYQDNYLNRLIRCWSQGDQGSYTDWVASTNTIFQLRFLQNGDLAYGTAEPSWGILDGSGKKRLEQTASIADYRFMKFLVSYDGSIVDFYFSLLSGRPARFFLDQQRLNFYPLPDSTLYAPDTTGLNITDWQHNPQPKINGTNLPLESHELSRSLAIAPNRSTFLLGTEWYLRLFDAEGKLLWTVPAPSTTWAVNISGDGQKAIAALGDGTIRWYNLSNGEELLAFFPHTDGKRWIAWTPSGYYMSSGEDADNLIGWHVNQGKDQAAQFYPISALQTEFKRPDVVKKVLDTLTEDKAVLVANLEKGIDAGERMTTSQRLELAKEKYQVKTTPSGLGKAIIVAASGEQQENMLFPYTNQFTQAMYNFLHDKGFSDGDIVYLNPLPPIVPSSGYTEIGRQDFSMRDPLQELTQAIDQVSSELKPGQQFIFYLHGHARAQEILLGRDMILSATQLKELLERLPKDVQQIIILDTCYSGSFLAALAGVPQRTVITSADNQSKAWTNEVKSFAQTFLQRLRKGDSVYQSFAIANQDIVSDSQVFGEQRPQLDDNQDGSYTDQDGPVAKAIYLGGQKVSASLPPEITKVHPAIYLDPSQTSATLWVETSFGLDSINQVQAILTNETDKPTDYQGEQTQATRREITLTPNYELQRFEAEYNGFQDAKQWRIFYQAESIEGDWSEFQVGFVRTDIDQTSVTVEAIVNQPVYQIGDPFRFEVMIAGEGNFDFYVGFLFPHGDYATIGYPFSFSTMNELLPYQKNLTLAKEGQTFTILSFGLGLPTMETGDYQACALLTKANSDPNENSNWVKLDCEGFRF